MSVITMRICLCTGLASLSKSPLLQGMPAVAFLSSEH
jgi:hypothetical protein